MTALCWEPTGLRDTPTPHPSSGSAGSQERAPRVAAPTRCNAGHGAAGLSTGGSGNCPEIPDGSRSYALRAEAPYPPDLPGRGNTRLTDPRPGHLCGGERHAGGADVRGWAGCIVRVGGLGDRVPGVAGGVTAASALQVRCNLAANPLQMGTCQTNGESAICAGDAGSIRQSRSVQRGMRV